MTEAGEKWFKAVCLRAEYVPDGAQKFDVAEFWVRVFCVEVEKQAIAACKKEHRKGQGPDNPPCDNHAGAAFDEFKRKLLGQ